MNKQRMVDDFMHQAGQYSGLDTPGIPNEISRRLRVKLIVEELVEFAAASGFELRVEPDRVPAIYYKWTDKNFGATDLVEAADALADLLYVVYGAAVAWGIKIDPVFGAVHDANMRKFGPGGYQRDDGKWMKPPDWQPPDVLSVLKAQGYEANTA